MRLAFVALSVPMTVLMVRSPRWLEPYRIQPKRPDFRPLIVASTRHLARNFAIALVASCAMWPLLRLSALHHGPVPPRWRVGPGAGVA